MQGDLFNFILTFNKLVWPQAPLHTHSFERLFHVEPINKYLQDFPLLGRLGAEDTTEHNLKKFLPLWSLTVVRQLPFR